VKTFFFKEGHAQPLHRTENVWNMRALTSEFLKQHFIDEFSDNHRMDLQTFAAKVQRIQLVP
jgi:hypothetical protein